MKSKILIIDNEGNTLANSLTTHGFHVHLADNGREGLTYLKEKVCELAIINMDLDDMTGLEFLKKARGIAPNLLIILLASNGSVESSVEAMQMGAFHYMSKPIVMETLIPLIQDLKEKAFSGKNTPIQKEHSNDQIFIAESAIMKKILTEVKRIATSQANVFISGESGTGKEVIAHALHYHSLRAKHPYIRVNCAALPETLIESEFFGHEKGAFTGASSLRQGRFELAHTGSLLLDEVTEIPLSLQAKLLRVVQEQEFERVGGTKPVKVNVRLISTTNRDTETAIREKRLRDDLFYRLNVVPIHIPPLRERVDDIVPLALYFLKKLCLDNLKEEKELSKEALIKLIDYSWPGNIRELGNVIERAIVMTDSRVIKPKDLFIEQKSRPKVTLEELERQHIIETLQSHQYDRSKAAKYLGITVRKLNNKIDTFQIHLP